MKVTTEAVPQRYGVYHRRDSRDRWALIVHTGDERAAFRLMLDVAHAWKGRGGDWAVRRLDNPPPSGSAVASGAGTRQGASSRE